MTVHTAVFTALILTLAGLLAVAFAPGDIATLRRARQTWRQHRATRTAWQAGADLTAGLALLTGELPVITLPPWRAAPAASSHRHLIPGRQPECPNQSCGGRRCRAAREGRNCNTDGLTERTAYWRTIPIGRHTLALAVARWWAGDWWAADLPVRVRRELGRAAGAGTIPAGAT